MASSELDLSSATWRKSSYSNGSGGDCLQVADSHPGDIVPVRDSKRSQDGPVLLIPAPDRLSTGPHAAS